MASLQYVCQTERKADFVEIKCLFYLMPSSKLECN